MLEQTVATARQKDSLGCVSNRLVKDIELNTGDFRFFRKCTQNQRLSSVTTPASDRGVLVGVSLNAGHHRRVFSGRRQVSQRFEHDSVYVRDFSDDYKADMHGDFDFVLVEMSAEYVGNAMYERSGVNAPGFSTPPVRRDPVLGHFAKILAHMLEHPDQSSDLFVEQLGVTIGTHIIEQYGGVPSSPSLPASSTRRLSHVHETRAKEMLMASDDGTSIEQIAKACNLSRSYFIRAFRETTHCTPHQWQLQQRIHRARELLASSDASLSEIALTCGFSDQSHFSRKFSQLVGTPPGNWRRTAGK
ncbi:AraC family transcriptional regulator [Paraburkholderia sp.]|uniref:helix-turn-helix domain-containing protein n=1 Tax=Paraburkholderia sp. TaxID=1926495 RepID=UPI002384FAD2|nr:AraC family transcriptional regulator [Paraburkholderia sp.]MDE1184755.1 AraC family transcriptional regulator [Paraburkholderia sp.]